MNEEKIIERLKAAQMAVDRERRLDFLALCDPARFEAAKSEYVRAWDAAGVVWDAAEAAEEEGDLAEAKRLWDLIASFDGEASERSDKILVKQQTNETKKRIKTMDKTYTVGVGSWTHMDGSPAPDLTCGHNHRTEEAADKCGTRLYAAKTVRGNWQACATWHGWYVHVLEAKK